MPNRQEAIDKYAYWLDILLTKRGELAEVKKAQARQRVEGFQQAQGQITERRQFGEAMSLDATLEIIDLEADIAIAEDHILYCRTIIENGA